MPQPNKLLSYDLHDPKDEELLETNINEDARSVFKGKMKEMGWKNYVFEGGIQKQLPNTTLVASKTNEEALSDLSLAQNMASLVDSGFELRKWVLTSFEILGVESDEPSEADQQTRAADILKDIG